MEKMTIDDLIKGAKSRYNNAIWKLDDVLLERLCKWVDLALKVVEGKIPNIIPVLKENAYIFPNWSLRNFFNIGFDDVDMQPYYRRHAAKESTTICNFIEMDVRRLFATITVPCNHNKPLYGWCASLFYIALLNYSREIQQEMVLREMALPGYEIQEERNSDGNKQQGSKRKFPIDDRYKHIVSHLFASLNDVAFQMTESEFGIAVENADFSQAYSQEGCRKNKIAYLTYILSKVMGSDWYVQASSSIGKGKSQCSGANVEEDMKQIGKEVERMKSKIDNTR